MSYDVLLKPGEDLNVPLISEGNQDLYSKDFSALTHSILDLAMTSLPPFSRIL